MEQNSLSDFLPGKPERLHVIFFQRSVGVIIAEFLLIQPAAKSLAILWQIWGSKQPIPQEYKTTEIPDPMVDLRTVMDVMHHRMPRIWR